MFHKIFLGVVLGFGLVAYAVFGAGTTYAGPNAIFTVNSVMDTSDGSCDALGTGTGNQDCTLREAIDAANANLGLDTIAFSIHGSGAQRITLQSDLSHIIDPVIVNGYTQPGAVLNTLTVGTNATTVIWVDGRLTQCQCGLILDADESAILGLTLNAPSVALYLYGSGDTIGGNVIGMEPGVDYIAGNHTGISVYGNGNLIGGTAPAMRNIITGNDTRGVLLNETAQLNKIQGNLIGTTKSGMFAPSGQLDLGNEIGIQLYGTANNTIGGASPTMRNVIAGNVKGIALTHGSNHNLIQNNYIGVSADGVKFVDLPYTPKHTIGVLLNDSYSNTIGDAILNGLGNVIVGSSAGVYFMSSCQCANAPKNNTVGVNLIGTDATGMKALNLGRGIVLRAGSDNTIEHNFISGNDRQGILLAGTLTHHNTIQMNGIGLAANGIDPLGNRGSGVFLRDGASDNRIGDDTVVNSSNVIAYNDGNGVTVLHSKNGPETARNEIAHNTIFKNKKLGIDLGNNGVTANDNKDTDQGPNGYQNYPVLQHASFATEQVQGTLNSKSNTQYDVQFFANSNCDPSGYGEGQRYLGSTTVTTNAQGKASFTFQAVSFIFLKGDRITSTATLYANFNATDTSEFSKCVKAQ